MRFSYWCIVVLLMCVSQVEGGSVYYVDDDSSGGLGNGFSWENAYTSLQDALGVAREGDEIRVAQGTYYPGADRADSFVLIKGVVVRGAYAGFGAADPDEWNPAMYEAVLSGDIGTTGVMTDNCYHVISLEEGEVFDENTVLSDCVIAYGYADGDAPYDRGGGLYCEGSAPRLTGCAFRSNQAAYRGGGLYTSGDMAIADCSFAYNGAGSFGGGLCGYDSTVSIERTSFTGNSAYHGAAVYGDVSEVFMRDSIVRGNAASYSGGAVHGYYSSGEYTNCLFADNWALYGGVLFSSHGDVELVNCTLCANTASMLGSAIYNLSGTGHIGNSIIWGNSVPDGICIQNSQTAGALGVQASFSCIEGGYAGIANIQIDPLFVGGGSFELSGGSPCIDRGDNSQVPGDVVEDLAGMPRFMDDPLTYDFGGGQPPIVDLGAYEYWADCNGNGVIDSEDISAGTSTDYDLSLAPDECEDCNSNGIADTCDVTCDGHCQNAPGGCGLLNDCNANGLPDECDVIAGGDFSGDGIVSIADYEFLADCMSSPGAAPTPAKAECVDACTAAFDYDDDTDVDLVDFASFQSDFE